MLLPTFLFSCKCLFQLDDPLIILESYKCHLMEIKGGIRFLTTRLRGQREKHWDVSFIQANLSQDGSGTQRPCDGTMERALNPELNSWANLISQLF